MSWVDSLTPADLAELKELSGRVADSQVFFDYLVLAITIRATGPIPVGDMSEPDDVVWNHRYADHFELRSDGQVHLKATRPRLVVVAS